MSSWPTVLLGALAVLSIAAEQGVSAQRSGNAAPDLAAIWARGGCTGGQPCPFIPTQLPLKARAIGFIQAFDEALGPKYDCAPATMPSLVDCRLLSVRAIAPALASASAKSRALA